MDDDLLFFVPTTITQDRSMPITSKRSSLLVCDINTDMNMSSNTRILHHRFLFFCCSVMLLLSSSSVTVVEAQSDSTTTTCTIEGTVFQAGEALGQLLTTRCGSADEFPCYCNPLGDPPNIACPYCGIATASGLVCARHDESISIINLEGAAQECSCRIGITSLTPDMTCVDDDDNDNDGGSPVSSSPVTAPSPSLPSDGMDSIICTLEWADGSTQEFQNGESYGELLPTECGPRYPCYCDTSKPGKVTCPYCQYTNNLGVVECARVDETFSGLTGDEANVVEQSSCTCQADFTSFCDGGDNSAPTNRPSLRPVASPTNSTMTPTPTPNAPSPNLGPIFNPPVVDVPTVSPTIIEVVPTPSNATTTLSPEASAPSPTLATPEPMPSPSTSTAPNNDASPTKPTFDKPTILLPNRPPVSSPVEAEPPNGCYYQDIDGDDSDGESSSSLGFVNQGESFGKHVVGPCAPWQDWPVYCNNDLPGDDNREYPYCVFSTTLGGGATTITTFADNDFVVCARSGERVSVPTSDGSIDDCSCLYLNPLLGPVSSCPLLLVDLSLTTPSPTDLPSQAPSTSPPSSSPIVVVLPTEAPTIPASSPSSSSAAAMSFSSSRSWVVWASVGMGLLMPLLL